MTRHKDVSDKDRRRVALPQLAPPRRRRYGRWRAATLIGVHVLIAAHIAHWWVAGQSLAPLELNEVMYTLELGIVTAGFVLMALAVLSVCVFGRFFCSWACHILALQDLCGWILRKLRIRAKPVRSRVLLLVAPLAAVYMLVWPQVNRIIEGKPVARLRLLDDSGGWASFVTDDFFRNLPGPWITLLTFAVCGFVIVYVLGTRSFCRYACPYGAVFGLMDRVAPGRIKVDHDKCLGCAVCTAVCESHVRVHEEIAVYGSVVDPACLKDLDCVGSCPEGALSFGWTRPSLLRSWRSGGRGVGYDFTLAEDALMAAVFLASLAIFRGLYGTVPFLLSLAIGGLLAYAAVLCVRLSTRPNVRLNAFQLKLKGRMTRNGAVFALLALVTGAFVVHSGLIRSHELLGQRALDRAAAVFQSGGDAETVTELSRQAAGHLAFCRRWGLLVAPGHEVRMASARWGSGDVLGAERSWAEAIEREPESPAPRLDLAASLMRRGRGDLAGPVLEGVTVLRERSAKDEARFAHDRASAWQALGSLAGARGDLAEAERAFTNAAAELPQAAGPCLALAELRATAGDLEGAARWLTTAVEREPEHAHAHWMLGQVLTQLGEPGRGEQHQRRAAELDPRYAPPQ